MNVSDLKKKFNSMKRSQKIIIVTRWHVSSPRWDIKPQRPPCVTTWGLIITDVSRGLWSSLLARHRCESCTFSKIAPLVPVDSTAGFRPRDALHCRRGGSRCNSSFKYGLCVHLLDCSLIYLLSNTTPTHTAVIPVFSRWQSQRPLCTV